MISQRWTKRASRPRSPGGAKHLYSIYRKMKEEELHVRADLRHDRVPHHRRERERLLRGARRHPRKWTPVPGRFKDYIALPKANMYQSLHTTVIGPRGAADRDPDPHARDAPGGRARHRGALEVQGRQRRDRRADRALRLAAPADRVAEGAERPGGVLSSASRIDLFPDEVFVFTPKGDVLDLPRGATAIDFAYRIHSQVGHHLTGARVNGRMVPLRYKLEVGRHRRGTDLRAASPGKDWLICAATARAKSRIRQWLRAQQAERSTRMGISLLDHELEPLGLTLPNCAAKAA